MISNNEASLAKSSPLQSSSSPKLKLFLLIEVIVITALLILISFVWGKFIYEPNINVALQRLDKFITDLVHIPPNKEAVSTINDYYQTNPQPDEVIEYQNLPTYNLKWLANNQPVELRVNFYKDRLVDIIVDSGTVQENVNRDKPLSIFKDERIKSTEPIRLQSRVSCITFGLDTTTSCREFTNQPDGLIAVGVSGGDDSGNFRQVVASFETSKLPYDTGTALSRTEHYYYSLNGFFLAFTKNIKFLPIVILVGVFLPLSIAAIVGYILAKKLFTPHNLLGVNVVFLPLAIVLILLNYLLLVAPVIVPLIENVFLGGIP